MKNKSFYSVITTLSLALFILVVGNVTGQTNNYTNNDDAVCGDIQVIASRIATTYHVDVEVVEPYVQAAVNLERSTGISASIVIAIAIHESSFNSFLFTNSGNPFGIKAGKPWDGPTFSKWDDGAESKFRAYSSAEEAVTDFGKFLSSRPWYSDALICQIDDYNCVLDGLKKTASEPGYSSNPQWDEAVMGIIERIGLENLACR
jgi:hypothetical protein